MNDDQRIIEAAAYLLDAASELLTVSEKVSGTSFWPIIFGAAIAALSGISVAWFSHKLEAKKSNRDLMLLKLEELFNVLKETAIEAAKSKSLGKRKLGFEAKIPQTKIDVIVACYFEKELLGFPKSISDSSATLHQSIVDYINKPDFRVEIIEQNFAKHIEIIKQCQAEIIKLIGQYKS